MAKGTSCIVHILGNLGSDPEVKYGANNLARTRLSVAHTDIRKDRDGNQIEETQWHSVTFFGKAAEVIGEYMRKGGKIYLTGTIRYRKDEESGKYYTDIIGDTFQMMGDGRQNNGGNGNGNGNGGNRQQPRQGQQQPDDDGSRQQQDGVPNQQVDDYGF
jgi:single-strand DNA-binding protein